MTEDELVALAATERNNGQEDQAIDLYRQAILKFEAAGNQHMAAYCHHMIGMCLKIDNRIDDALAALNQAKQMYQSIDDQTWIANVERDIGLTLGYRHEYEAALVHLRRSEQVLMQTGDDPVGLGITQAKIGLIHLRQSDYDEAETKMRQGLLTVEAVGHPFMETTIHLHLAELLFAQKAYQAMIDQLWAGVGLLAEAGEMTSQNRRLSQIYGLLAQGYAGLRSKKRAIELFSKALTYMRDLKPEVRTIVYEDIHAQDFWTNLTDQQRRAVLEIAGYNDFEASDTELS